MVYHITADVTKGGETKAVTFFVESDWLGPPGYKDAERKATAVLNPFADPEITVVVTAFPADKSDS